MAGGGVSYVYFTYGMGFMFNVVAKKKTEDAGAVLIRALEPIKGIKIMELIYNYMIKIIIKSLTIYFSVVLRNRSRPDETSCHRYRIGQINRK